MHLIILALPYVFQLALIIHIIKTNKPFYWLYLIIFIPYLGGVAYILIELLPALLSSREIRQAGQSLARTLNPSAELKKLEEQLKNQDTVSNRSALAQAYIEAERFSDALPLTESCLTGPFADDAALLFLHAQALYGNGRVEEAAAILEKLQKKQSLSSVTEKLFDIQVRSSLLKQPLTDDFEKLWNESKNFEAGFYYVQALVKSGKDGSAADSDETNREKARLVIEDMQRILKTYRNFSRSIGAEWLKKAKSLV
ncbi:hypothetical protein H0R92_07775 [Treponema sp. OMZ 840]|uniref:hypothetical protein n=1 Tax=Treponema sp. OMZ 840 TaxID=244313 RepID=UPI003D919CB2